MTTFRWEPPTYQPHHRIADIDGIGRYWIGRPTKYSLTWELRLNGQKLGKFASLDAAMKAAEAREDAK